MGQRIATGMHNGASRQNVLANATLQQAFDKEQKQVKLLLLGTGESGKSTLLKQMKLLYSDSQLTAEVQQSLLTKIREGVIENLQILTKAAEQELQQMNPTQLEGFRSCILLETHKVSEFLSFKYKHVHNPEITDTRPVLERPRPVEDFGLNKLPANWIDDDTSTVMEDNPTDQRTFHKLNPRPKFSNFGMTNINRDLGDTVIPKTLVEFMEVLWVDPIIKLVWRKRNTLPGIQATLPHFMLKLKYIFKKLYIPDEEDWLLVRVKSTGIQEESFSLDDAKFKIIDVGGQKNERKKWMHCFDNVNAIIWVVALSEYDQVVTEEATKNRMMDSLELFDETVSNPALSQVGWIVFFNKYDLYRKKLNKSSIRNFEEELFLDFEGPYCPPDEPNDSQLFKDCADAGYQYFVEKFHRIAHNRSFFAHRTCAMDQHNIDVVFTDTRTVVMTQLMMKHGLLLPRI